RDTLAAEPGPRMLAHKVIGWGYMGKGQVDPAIEQFELAVSEAERWGDKVSLATAHETLGQQNYLGGRFTEARDHLAPSLSLYRESANELRAVFALHILCRIWIAQGDHDRANDQIRQALDLEIEGRERFAADAHQILGVIHVVRSEWEEAKTSFQKAVGIF